MIVVACKERDDTLQKRVIGAKVLLGMHGEWCEWFVQCQVQCRTFNLGYFLLQVFPFPCFNALINASVSDEYKRQSLFVKLVAAIIKE